ncbi:MAG: hypothetical protein ABL973_06525 [Micropepsaceae bacterium]
MASRASRDLFIADYPSCSRRSSDVKKRAVRIADRTLSHFKWLFNNQLTELEELPERLDLPELRLDLPELRLDLPALRLDLQALRLDLPERQPGQPEQQPDQQRLDQQLAQQWPPDP